MNDGAVAQATVGDPEMGIEGASSRPEPLLPDWDGACIHRVVPTLLSELAHPGATPLPAWFPAPVAQARQIVLLVIDGLGAEQMYERTRLAPVLTAGTGGTGAGILVYVK